MPVPTNSFLPNALSTAPRSGAYSLWMYDGTDRYGSTAFYQSAVLHVNLAAASQVTLDFWARHSGGASYGAVLLSADGVNWTTLLNTSGRDAYDHYVYNLDALGLAYTADFRIQFRHISSWAGGMWWDDIRVAAGEDVFGSRVVSQTPVGTVAGPLSEIQLTFNEEIDAASFTAADVTVLDPGGAPVAVRAVNPVVDSGDHRTFTVHFAAPQAQAGHYTVSVGPGVLDMAGNGMNQNGDHVQEDGYSGSFDLSVQPAAPPLIEGFETGGLSSAWGALRNAGVVRLTNANAMDGGSAMEFSSTQAYGSYYQDLILHADLAGRTGVVLDYWIKEISGGGRSDDFSVSISPDGTNWTLIPGSAAAGGSLYQHFVFDVDALNLAYTSDTRIKFHRNSYYTGSFALDGVRLRSGVAVLNHAPTLTAVTTLSGISEDSSLAISYEMLAAAANEADAEGSPLSFRIDAVSSGTLAKGGAPVSGAGTLLGAGESVVWTPAADANGTLNAFTVRAWDGELVSGTAIQVKVAVTAINDAPVLDNSGSPALSSLPEDTAAPAGDTVGSIVGTSVTDADAGALKGIAVIGLTGTASGTWQYNTGAGWGNFGAVSEAAARLLRDTDKVRFVPAANFSGSATIAYRAWDRTTGSIGGTANASSNGGATAFSAAVETAAITVLPVNDPPSGADRTLTMLEDGSCALLPGDFVFIDSSDNPAHALLAVKIATLPTAGTLTLDGAAVVAGSSVPAAEIQAGRLRFLPAPNANGVGYAGFTFQIQDDGGTANGGADLDPSPNTFTFHVTPVPDLVGRHLFYNNSAWDGGDPAANRGDYDAIAPASALSGHGHSGILDEPTKELSKQALLPGLTATFVHYTSYAKGLNGIILVFDNLADPAALSLSDFVFRVGNSNTPADWIAAPAPQSIRVARDAVHPNFPGNPDVVTLTWADEDPYTPSREAGAISNQWLQVTVLAGAGTGLPVNDVYYFGNQIGESGNSPADTNVDQNDEIGARNHPHTTFNAAPISDPYDFNRDGKVDQNDEILARNAPASAFTRIALLAAPAMLRAQGLPAVDGQVGARWTIDTLAAVVEEAITRWESTGLDLGPLRTLRQTQFAVMSFLGSEMGEASSTSEKIWLDDDAAGFGWFIDRTPDQNEEFGPTGSTAMGKMDLLTAVMHEMGHVLGKPDVDTMADDLMADNLVPGVRRALSAKLPSLHDAVFAGDAG